MKIIAAFLLALGVGLIAYSCVIPPYTDTALFNQRYSALHAGQSKEFFALRDSMRSPKYKLQDYGISLMALSFGLLALSRKGWRNIKSPRSRAGVTGVAVAAPVVASAGFMLDLMLGSLREEFPHWADSLGIPMMGIQAIFVFTLVWSLAHLIFMRRRYRSEYLWRALSPRANWWLLANAAIAAALALLFFFSANWWNVMSFAAWTYFYLSLAASRRPEAAPALPVPARVADLGSERA